MNNIAEFFLNAIERSIVGATSINFQSLADDAEPCLRMAGLHHGRDTDVFAGMRRIEDLIIALCEGLANKGHPPRDVDQLRIDALAELAFTRKLIESTLPIPITMPHLPK